MRRRIALIGLAITATAWTGLSATAQADQLGAHYQGIGMAIEARAHMTQPSATWNGSYNRVYQIGAVFPDGEFFQAGYLDGSPSNSDLSCSTGLSWWVTALDQSNHSLFSKTYYNGPCTLTGSHLFRLSVISSTDSSHTWGWFMDGDRIGPSLTLPLADYEFARHNIQTFSEIVSQPGIPCSGPNANNCSTPLPTVDYYPALAYMPIDNSGWQNAPAAAVIHSGNLYCPPYYLSPENKIGFTVGNDSNATPSTECWADGDPLW